MGARHFGTDTVAQPRVRGPKFVSHSTPPAGAVGGEAADMRTNAIDAEIRPMAPLPATAPNLQLLNRALAPTPIKLKPMLPFLHSYTNQSDAKRLISGFTYGFSLSFKGTRVQMSCKNLKSAILHHHIIMQKIEKEVLLGRIVGPFTSIPFPNFRCSPIGVVPKRTPGEFRLIQHLSSPRGSSVNDSIDKDECNVSYTSFDRAVDMIGKLGLKSFMGKADIKSAFRLLPVHPVDFDLLGMCIDGKFYYDRCMPMGCAISCAMFERFSSFLEDCCRRIAVTEQVLHYLDDFFFAASSFEECQRIMLCFQNMCKDFGVPLALEKTEGPTRVITYLGLEIDTKLCQVKVPADKLEALSCMICNFSTKSKLTLRQLQSLIGSLNFVCKAVGPGRAFLRRLIDMTRGVSQPHHRIRLTSGAKADLAAWEAFLEHFNGTVMFADNVWRDNNCLQFYTDAAASIGLGIYFEGCWAQAKWPEYVREANFSIAVLELLPIVVGVHLWGDRLNGKRVTFWSDNQSVVAVINKQSSNCKIIMRLIRHFVVLCLRWNIWFKAMYVPGHTNEIADSLSRFQMTRFRHLAPNAEQQGTPIPTPLWSSLVGSMPSC